MTTLAIDIGGTKIAAAVCDENDAITHRWRVTTPMDADSINHHIANIYHEAVAAGHLDVIERCARFFDEVHVVVAVNAAKTPMFSEETRVEIIRQALAKRGCTNVKVASTTGLITDYCTKIGATVIVKGLRQNGDYEAELGMALVNRKLAGVETLFLPAAPDLEHISSSIVKDVARHGGDVTGMVPDCVIPLLGEALKNEKRA